MKTVKINLINTLFCSEKVEINLVDILLLQKLYKSFKENQYPDRATKESLAKELELTFQQVLVSYSQLLNIVFFPLLS